MKYLFLALALSAMAARSQLCEFECPSGTKMLQDYEYVSNGCGSETMGIRVDPEFAFEPCCDLHDACYEICGMARETCEDEFSSCMKKVCDGLTNEDDRARCSNQQKLFVFGTTAFGCVSFLSAQKESCTCAEPSACSLEAQVAPPAFMEGAAAAAAGEAACDPAKQLMRGALEKMYGKLSMADKAGNATFIESTLDKHEAKYPELVLSMIKQYPKQLIKMKEWGASDNDADRV
ncbi:unnamed protein product [Vitrella brassicaformis CCMP3155]|uniref:Phospholipase A2 n=1 Tax=Vitrella brassicaformis (strain CCMP3155) TaxID=1169540 RepID=A0A0G4ENX1_VITBC|nr:unnamed protein product [Vitrella brassicaformis CCMP3155]|eukprot:CEL99495.1 unnamed protein product [Vitrella brassicaformis CCMP3155]